jgi:hypothetical protein
MTAHAALSVYPPPFAGGTVYSGDVAIVGRHRWLRWILAGERVNDLCCWILAGERVNDLALARCNDRPPRWLDATKQST